MNSSITSLFTLLLLREFENSFFFKRYYKMHSIGPIFVSILLIIAKSSLEDDVSIK